MAVVLKSTYGYYTETLLWGRGHINHFVVCLQRSKDTDPTLSSLTQFVHLIVGAMP